MSKKIHYGQKWPRRTTSFAIRSGDVLDSIDALPEGMKFDLVLTSPPYNIGKEYEERLSLRRYLRWQADVIDELAPKVLDHGSICWQVGNYVQNGHIEPLDMHMHTLFTELGFRLRNRIVWRFGHGLHSKRRFSGRYEVVLWYSKSDD